MPSFIGVVQVLVYAGAVMVLFLFIIMLLDLRSERPRRSQHRGMGRRRTGGLRVCRACWARFFRLSSGFDMEKPLGLDPQISDVSADRSNALLRHFNLPFQIIGVLLLVATVGVVILSKKELK
mgnify:CR=1 FL=1